jgi:DNA-binding NtrC family response regulator
MSGESGSQFLAWLRKQYPHVIRIMLTGAASPSLATRQAIREGRLHQFLSKPISCEELARALRNALQAKQREEERSNT